MPMMPHPRDRARSGWGTALGSPPSDPLLPRTSSLAWRVERPESVRSGRTRRSKQSSPNSLRVGNEVRNHRLMSSLP